MKPHKTTLKERQMKRAFSMHIHHTMMPQLALAKGHERKMKRSAAYRKAYAEHLKKQEEKEKVIEV